MRFLDGLEAKFADEFFKDARRVALDSRYSEHYNYRRTGALVVKDNKIITEGFDSYIHNENFISADEVAIRKAIATYDLSFLRDSSIYVAKLNSQNQIEPTANYSSKIGSLLAWASHMKEWIFLQEQGFCAYNAKEYYELCFRLREWGSKSQEPKNL
jgi:hypothetical protein